ncbi:hypothetical protein DYB25_005728 [Aphanomyces astaci]|uniref:Peptidase C1A papain C-terminal domain-containing protein n=2 Tax=Aphanomyces astaci TaxID=112090 RepID=A0A397C6U5_APHAT|nr:hypothetical protein DYB25_005728 [Aphanomyces astaci]RHY38482.1 hypothetical protein DYB30_003984 [Aphanomyces astaci]RHY46041.1 hypothetical protein DYB38_005086 [Aphanomyces astaci]RHZ16584.1 hypothetical protein DYB26_003317 [Aphanomyces astaci]RHZ38377.1 hypothetical protein DYB31_004481 [Aphanomyces astaci]
MLQWEERSPLYSSNGVEVVRSASVERRQSTNWWWVMPKYGFPVLVLLNMVMLAVLGVQLHRSYSLQARFADSMDTPAATVMYHTRGGGVVAALLPIKFAVDHVTPYKNQAGRGTCWDFGTIGALEQSYRKHGVAEGWLDSNEYVSFSEQAYGIEVMEMCTGPIDSPQQHACRIADDNVWRNSTEGGEVPLLYYLHKGLKDSVFPVHVCPYTSSQGHDWDCPELAIASVRKSNPLSFTVNDMGTFYDQASIKRKLVQSGLAMPVSTTLVSIQHMYPCVGKLLANDPRCDAATCQLCPPELPMATCCVPADSTDGQNMDGEFLAHSGMQVDGGHLVVAYNDLFRTREGATGGFVVKNSWQDGWQGSHSMAYWMQDISEWDDRVVCPNSFNPFNWYVPTQDDGVVDIAACLSDDSVQYAALNRQPLHLTCVDDAYCVPGRVYFAKNRTSYGDRMHVMCFWEYDPTDKSSKHVCLPPMLQETIARTFEPDEVYENDSDLCGFYFLPYDTISQVSALFQGFFVNSFDVEWAPQSYVANREKFPHLDYSLVQASTFTQHSPDRFDGPFPFAHKYKPLNTQHRRHHRRP